MKKLFFIMGCLLVLGSTPAWAQQAPEVVTVRVQEENSRLTITTSRSGSTVVETQQVQTSRNQTFAQLAAQQYQQLLTTYVGQGYELKGIVPSMQSSINSIASSFSSINTFLFVKSAPKP